jgi:hypothetical protein
MFTNAKILLGIVALVLAQAQQPPHHQAIAAANIWVGVDA